MKGKNLKFEKYQVLFTDAINMRIKLINYFQ